jgi:hypothetical protein
MIKKIFLWSCFLIVLPTYAVAGLGGSVDSFPNSSTPSTIMRHVVTAVSNSTTSNSTTSNSVLVNYSTQLIHDDVGTLITEYVTSKGVVFALTWHGLFKPDLHQLLGDYFKTYLSTESQSSRRQPQIVDQRAVIIVSEGRLRNFHGYAYIPALVPSGFSLDNLK